MLKIGTCNHQDALWQAAFTQAELARIGVESEVVILGAREEDTEDTGLHLSWGALLRGEVDMVVHAMEQLPTELPEGLVITAVSQRDNPAELLVIRPEAHDPAKIFKIKSGAVIGASSDCRKSQMQEIRPDTVLQDAPGEPASLLRQLREGQFDAVFLAAAEVHRLKTDLGGLEVLELNPREFVPAPAQGVTAWQTHRDDLPTRRILRQIHHPEVSACTNVERRVLQLLGGDRHLPLGVYCERDATGNFHAYAACRLQGDRRWTRISQSTNAGLAERLFEQLNAG